MAEDFTHVLPEDPPERKPRPPALQVFDLAEANARAKQYQAFREQLEEIENKARAKMQEQAAILKAGK